MNYNLYTRIHKNFSYTIKLAKNGIGIKEIINEDVLDQSIQFFTTNIVKN